MASAVQIKKCEEVDLCQPLKNVNVFKLQRSQAAREPFAINPGDSVLVSCLVRVCTQRGGEIGLCFVYTFIYGVDLFSESHFLVFFKAFSYNQNNVHSKASRRLLHLLTS